MTRVVNDKIEVYFLQHNSGTAAADVEISFSLEEYLLIAREAGSLENLRAELITSGMRKVVAKTAKAGR